MTAKQIFERHYKAELTEVEVAEEIADLRRMAAKGSLAGHSEMLFAQLDLATRVA
jgi:hypothetical protein